MRHTELVTRHYLIAALWSSVDEHGEPLDAVFTLDDVSDATKAEALADVEGFVLEAGSMLEGLSAEQIGHDFWLTRNHHGAGFWDRGLGEQGEILTRIAQSCGAVCLYAGDDGWVYSE